MREEVICCDRCGKRIIDDDHLYNAILTSPRCALRPAPLDLCQECYEEIKSLFKKEESSK